MGRSSVHLVQGHWGTGLFIPKGTCRTEDTPIVVESILCEINDMSLLEYFRTNEKLRLESIAEQNCVQGNTELAQSLDKNGELLEFEKDQTFIHQGDEDKYIFLILSGTCDIIVNGRIVASRGPRNHVGEMAVIQPTQRRSADCVARENLICLRVEGSSFDDISKAFPEVYRPFAKELARRLMERNNAVPTFREKIRVFLICSAESLAIARAIQDAFEHDPFNVVIWTDGVFKVATYPIETLELELENTDFAVALAHTDDLTLSRDREWPSPRDNVIFELGMFLGRLGRSRAILMEPRDGDIKLPSDLSGITTIPYSFPDNRDEIAATMAPACNKLRNHIEALGPYNG